MSDTEKQIIDIFKSRGMDYEIDHQDGFDAYNSNVNGKGVSILYVGGNVIGGIAYGNLRVSIKPCLNNYILTIIARDIDDELAKEGKA